MESAFHFVSRSAEEAAKLYSLRYAAYLDSTALEYATKFPDRADYFMTRSLSEALSGNEGN